MSSRPALLSLVATLAACAPAGSVDDDTEVGTDDTVDTRIHDSDDAPETDGDTDAHTDGESDVDDTDTGETDLGPIDTEIVDTVVPGDTEVPVDTVVPGDTEVPVETEVPGDSEVDTEVAVDTERPADSDTDTVDTDVVDTDTDVLDTDTDVLDTDTDVVDTDTDVVDTGTTATVFVFVAMGPNGVGANLGGRPGADVLATQAVPAALSGADLEVHALLSLTGDAVVDFPTTWGLPADAPVVAIRTDGTEVALADDWGAFVAGPLSTTLGDALGLTPIHYFWSGTNDDGTATGQDCIGWTRSWSALGTISQRMNVTTGWLREAEAPCEGMYALLGVAWSDRPVDTDVVVDTDPAGDTDTLVADTDACLDPAEEPAFDPEFTVVTWTDGAASYVGRTLSGVDGDGFTFLNDYLGCETVVSWTHDGGEGVATWTAEFGDSGAPSTPWSSGAFTPTGTLTLPSLGAHTLATLVIDGTEPDTCVRYDLSVEQRCPPADPLSVSISPAAPTTTDDLVATITGGSGSRIVMWSRAGDPAPYPVATLPASLTTKGDTWTVLVLDMVEPGTSATASVTVVNAPPVVSDASILVDVAPGDTCGVVTCDASSSDPDLDALTAAQTWSVGGVPVGIGPTFPEALVAATTVTCAFSASDGAATGEQIVSATIDDARVLDDDADGACDAADLCFGADATDDLDGDLLCGDVDDDDDGDGLLDSEEPDLATDPDDASDPTLRRAFVSSSGTSGRAGVAPMDLHCRGLADAAGLPGTYVALLSTGTRDAIARVDDAVHVRTDGVAIATSRADLFDGALRAPLSRDETGATQSLLVFTGSSGAGTVVTNRHCESWTARPGNGQPWYGHTARSDAPWISAGEDGPNGCTGPTPVYCVQVADTDADGLSDRDEAHRGTIVDDPDSDDDGRSDGDEVYVYGSNPLVADPA